MLSFFIANRLQRFFLIPVLLLLSASALYGGEMDNSISEQELLQSHGGMYPKEYSSKSLSLWMQQHTTRPLALEHGKHGGEAVVRLRIDPDGHLLASKIEQSSGYQDIDNAVLQIVQDSAPFPPLPKNSANKISEYLIPIVISTAE